MGDGLYVQYGCGWDAPNDWANFDSSPTLRIERLPILGRRISVALKRNAAPFPDNVQYGDIVKGLPLREKTCNGIYCSHVLEHLSLNDFRRALINTRKLLKPDGVFRLVLPDLAFHAAKYVTTDSPDSALEFMRESGLGELSRARGIKGLVREIMGNSRHRWMWDFPSLERELRQAGFKDVRKATLGDSVDIKFHQLERKDRWDNCLGAECKRI